MDKWPEEVVRTFDAMDEDPTVYHAMNGPNEFHVIGSMKNWDVIPRLGKIQVPTLLISVHYDESAPECVQPLFSHIQDWNGQYFLNRLTCLMLKIHDIGNVFYASKLQIIGAIIR
ncbi:MULTISPECIES: hypothetical protein [Vibrio]|uniref:hypothetical protein n=1 Tax=Vibrio TaxID=662 RepID=UPI000B2AB43D|nr:MULTISPECIES: hypothetical protein [Vibrio]MCO7023013.1 hypothetical protein [Vibrio paracholerae]